MNARNQKTATAVKEAPAAKQQEGMKNADDCRCKETSDMSPRQLLGLMFKDLAFWKRTKKG